MRVDILVLDGVFDLGLSALQDSLAMANWLAKTGGAASGALFCTELVGVRRQVRTQHGLRVPVQTVAKRRRPDVLMLPGPGSTTPEGISTVLERRDVADAQELIVKWDRRGTRICTACGGTFMLAGTSLLDGGVATTTWWLAPMFRERFPEIDLDETQMVVTSGNCVTAGAALAHLDLALWLIRQVSPALATQVARYLVIDPRPSPGAYALPDQLAHSDPVVEQFERWARATLSEPFDLATAATAVAVSPRTLSRRMNKVLGKAPVAYVQQLRVERAIHLLRTTAMSVDDIASEVGYGDGVTLRNLLRRKTGYGVREIRARSWAQDSEPGRLSRGA